MAKSQGDKLGIKLSKVCEKYNLTVKDVFLAELVALGYPRAVAFREIMNYSFTDCSAACDMYMAKRPDISKYIAVLKNGTKKSTSDNSMFAEGAYNLRTKDGVLAAMEEEANRTQDPKQRADIILKIADLQKMKNEDDKEQKKLVHYYLPLRCERCPMNTKTKA